MEVIGAGGWWVRELHTLNRRLGWSRHTPVGEEEMYKEATQHRGLATHPSGGEKVNTVKLLQLRFFCLLQNWTQ